MKILHCVESYFPSVGGMQEVVKQLSERIVKLGHEVTVATRKDQSRNFSELNGVKLVEFDISGNLVSGIKGEASVYEQFLLNSNFDIVTFFAAQQWATDLALPLLDRIKGKKVSVPTGYSGFYLKEYSGYFESMKKYILKYDMNVYLSDNYRDINFARANHVSKMCLIPNGAGADEFLVQDKINVRERLKLDKETLLFLHVGSFTGIKGQMDAIKIVLDSRAKNCTLLLIGNNFEPYKRQFYSHYRYFLLRIKARLRRVKIVFGFFDRNFTVAAYKQSDLFIFPSNIECSPIVLFECAAAKTPFLATDVGNSSEIAGWTKGGLILPTDIDANGESHARIKESADMLNELLADVNKRRAMAEAAFSAWQDKYSWEKISLEYESLYLSLL